MQDMPSLGASAVLVCSSQCTMLLSLGGPCLLCHQRMNLQHGDPVALCALHCVCSMSWAALQCPAYSGRFLALGRPTMSSNIVRTLALREQHLHLPSSS